MKLNIGCGNRYLPGWENLDFRPVSSDVKAWDLRRKLPYPDGSMDLVYSSHLLEHLSPEQAAALLKDSLRVLKPGGIVRAVVPDLEALARGYLGEVERCRVDGCRGEVERCRVDGCRGEVERCRLQVAGGRLEVDGEAEDGGRRTEDGGQRAEVGGQRTEDGGRRTEDGGQRAEDSKNSPQRAQRDSEDPDTFEDKPSTFNLQPSTLLERYDWSVIFLIDQLVRTDTGGRMLARLAEYKGELPEFLRKRFPEKWRECVLGERGEGRGETADDRLQTADYLGKDGGQTADCRLQTTDFLGKDGGQTADCRLQTTDFLGGEASGSEDAKQGLRSAVCGLWSLHRRIAPGLRWRWRVVMEALERALRKHCPGMADRLDCWRVARYLAQGERHQWMYDEVSMKRLMEDCGFVNVQRVTAGSTLSPFEDDLRRLDMTADGGAYQPSSLYVEGGKGDDGGRTWKATPNRTI